MKILIILLFSLHALADQGDLLAVGRDQYVQESLRKIKQFCKVRRPELPLDENHHYLCILQAKADCSHAKEPENLIGCELIQDLKNLEKRILLSDKNLASIGKSDIASSLVNSHGKSLDTQIREAREKLKHVFVDKSCEKDSDCKKIYYGTKGCVDGREDYIPANNNSPSEQFSEALSEYNELKQKADLLQLEGFACMAVVVTYKVSCQAKVCTSSHKFD